MHRFHIVVVFALLCPGARIAAQSDSLKASRNNAGIVLSALEPMAKGVLGLAQAMPADKYDFVPTAGRFAGTRSYAEQLKHIAADLYLDGGAILGDQLRGNVTRAEAGDPNVRTKEQVIAYVRDAFDYMERAARTIDDANELVPRPSYALYGPPRSSRLRIAIMNIEHTYDHYGQLVEYLRMNGIVPPGST
ncbi:MAG TPA: DinB family protein [Gemmatimonadaceae bacterium]|nr:DinB family protein [Gemmatimonadaceae bacterium]